MHKKLTLLLTFSFTINLIFANENSNVIDSLRNRLYISERSEKLELLQHLILAFTEVEDSADKYINIFEIETKKQKSPLQETAILRRVEFLIFFSHLKQLETFVKENIPYLLQNKHYNTLFIIEDYLIKSLYNLKKENEAFERAKKLYEEAKKIGTPDLIAMACQTLGYFYETSKRYDDAYKFYNEALQFAFESGENRIIGNSYFYLAPMQLETKRYQEAIYSCNEIWKMLQEQEKKPEMAHLDFSEYFLRVLSYKAGAYTHLKKFEDAKNCLIQAENTIKKDWPPSVLFPFYEYNYLYYYHTGNYAKALHYIEQMIEILTDFSEIIKLDYLAVKADILFKLNDYKSASTLYNQIYERYDSLKTIDYIKQLEDLRLRYENAEKENLISQQKSQLQKFQFLIVFTIAGLILLSIIISLIMRYNRNIRNKNKILISQINLLSSKETELSEFKKQKISTTEQLSIFDHLKELMENDKLFLKSEINRDDVSRTLFTNSMYLGDAIKENTGLTFSNYITKLRLEYAKNLLVEQPKTNIANVAFDAGFNSSRTFNRLFKEFYGLTPGEFRDDSYI